MGERNICLIRFDDTMRHEGVNGTGELVWLLAVGSSACYCWIWFSSDTLDIQFSEIYPNWKHDWVVRSHPYQKWYLETHVFKSSDLHQDRYFTRELVP